MTPGKISRYGFVAGIIILGATLLRLVLIRLGWPLTNSDEGTMGIMALHIAYRGDHPTFFYGQHYMGSWEAFLGAGLFHLFGPSLFVLRMGTVLMIALALLALYLLSRLLFPRTWAVVSLLLAASGSGFAMAQEIRAIGGYAETLLFSSLLFLTATWLVLTYQRKPLRNEQMRRWLFYLAWGLAAGLGLWTDLLIAPMIIASGLLLLLVCWRELARPLPLLCLLAGLCIGAAPLISYNLHALPNEDSLTVFRALHDQGGIALYTPSAILAETSNTFGISLPLMTGEPFCPVTEIPFLGPTSSPGLVCTVARGSWGLGYLLIFAFSFALVVRGIWQVWHTYKNQSASPEIQRNARQQLARLSLLLGAALSLALYTFSSGPLIGPGLHARYLICLLVATPATFWSLWEGLRAAQGEEKLRQKALRALCAIVLLCFCGLTLTGSVLAFSEVSAATALNQRDAALIHDLERLGIRHFYTDYWTCDKIVFESDERIICAVVDTHLRPDHNRYLPYFTEVAADPFAAYVFPLDTEQFQLAAPYTFLTNIHQPGRVLPLAMGMQYRRIVTDGYVITYSSNMQRTLLLRGRTGG
jgi:4-amino-4-deoxy-L-arabinose transferase-like glycosyltransferase